MWCSLPHAEGLPLPSYQSAQAAGMDLVAALPEDSPLTLAPMQRALVPTGLIFALPEGTEGQVRPRSGLAVKRGLTVLNSPGTIDADYRGEVSVLLINLGNRSRRRSGAASESLNSSSHLLRLCNCAALNSVASTQRGAGGFGSTGI